MNRSRFALILPFALLLTSCNGKQSAEDYFSGSFNAPLPTGTKCSEFHTSYERENDRVFAVEFQDEAQSKAFCSKWGLSRGFSGEGEIFKYLKSIISETQFEKDLVKDGWSMSPGGYDAYEGKMKTGREFQVYLSVGRRRMLVFILGG
jgi:hypothetical protein